MPKRDLKYMADQRGHIAKAALEVMLEKGVYDTSLRDICLQAGVSMGSLYIHYACKEEIVVAAFALDNAARPEGPVAERWPDYERQIMSAADEIMEPRVRNRARLSLQFVAQMIVAPKQFNELSQIFVDNDVWVRASLLAMFDRGELSLPLGLDATTDAHMRLLAGTAYTVFANPNVAPQKAFKAAVDAMSQLAGRTDI